MPDKRPIDYARAESDDVVRKRYRRRRVLFILATVVVILIGLGWRQAITGGAWSLGSSYKGDPISLNSQHASHTGNSWLTLVGPQRQVGADWKPGSRSFGSRKLGIYFSQFPWAKSAKWQIIIYYRTLFFLAMIPWIITFVRLIPSWRKKRKISPNDPEEMTANTVRKIHSRRVVTFAAASVALILVGFGWLTSPGRTWWIGDFLRHPLSLSSNNGWITLFGPLHETTLEQWEAERTGVDTFTVGDERQKLISYPRWQIDLRYRTLFTLAMIPWLITLIRMIRIARVKHAVQIDR